MWKSVCFPKADHILFMSKFGRVHICKRFGNCSEAVVPTEFCEKIPSFASKMPSPKVMFMGFFVPICAGTEQIRILLEL